MAKAVLANFEEAFAIQAKGGSIVGGGGERAACHCGCTGHVSSAEWDDGMDCIRQ